MSHLIFQQYEERLVRREAKPNTLKNLRRTATLFGESGLDPLATEDWQIEEWLAGLPVSPRTKRLHMENLSAVYNYAVHRRILQIAPTESVRLPREPDKEPRILENSELRQLLRMASDDQQYLMLNLLVYTGVRRNELRNLTWEDVTAQSIRVAAGKGDKLRHIPVHPALAEVLVGMKATGVYLLHGHKRYQPISESGLFSRLERAKGDIDCTFHDFRRTVATSLAENEVPERYIDLIMGWSPRTVGSRYYIRRADGRAQEAILQLYANDPISLRASSKAMLVANSSA